MVRTTTGTQVRLPSSSDNQPPFSSLRTNFDKYHPGYFGKVGMRRFHLTRNLQWRPIINVDKLWTLVPAEEKEGLTESSEVVPVIDTLRHGYGKVLGNGQCVSCMRLVIRLADFCVGCPSCRSSSRRALSRRRPRPKSRRLVVL